MISKAAVVGAGLMGTGIARHLSSQHIDVLVIDASLEQLEKARGMEENKDLSFSNELKAISDRDFVIEAVFEDLDVKLDVLKAISHIVGEDCIVASNTSSLLIKDLAQSIESPNRFIGVHYNNPADMNPVVEIIASELSDISIAEGVHQWMNQANKLAIRCADTPCFVLNRQSLPYINEAARCLKIATPGEIDKIATTKLGVGLGPFAVMNLVGLPVMAAASRHLAVLGEGYASAEQLQAQQEPWEIDEPGEANKEVTSEVVRRLRGAMIFPGKDILDQNLCSRDDLHEICVQALGYEKSSAEWLEILTPTVKDELISIYLNSCR
ncbi:MAG: 3-hydroxyacyl-CoA dehydrogenase family protein [Pseudomonadales bacterium]|nr:3-hydroxyacyl-CoA dehydrogenase family protein [Pseudomonadales bacterium]MBO6564879.1 3-hydroxyacyl-CoA dehydrogenase family protein [Pseudomonadales bacterium]MBO6596795.1 3-hydroxyacyl-CoA dehydrogenase family protein [Pseudomonadales bacterium]MBO6703465.1 3-hydroxyacyl-CoA dehydrogenase family protein [Pseudomonadales bacterium]MBO6823216.1 3-hydroxyacyl-CoA dehydrogenase family protein [Pseudomonadales bacterium]